MLVWRSRELESARDFGFKVTGLPSPALGSGAVRRAGVGSVNSEGVWRQRRDAPGAERRQGAGTSRGELTHPSPAEPGVCGRGAGMGVAGRGRRGMFPRTAPLPQVLSFGRASGPGRSAGAPGRRVVLPGARSEQAVRAPGVRPAGGRQVQSWRCLSVERWGRDGGGGATGGVPAGLLRTLLGRTWTRCRGLAPGDGVRSRGAPAGQGSDEFVRRRGDPKMCTFSGALRVGGGGWPHSHQTPLPRC